MLGSPCPPLGLMAWPDTHIRGPTTNPLLMARFRAKSVPPKADTLRILVKPAARVRRAA